AGRGIFCRATAAADIFYNDIRNNSGEGLYLAGADGSSVHYNNLSDNLGPYALVNGNSASLDARFNYWGVAVTNEMDAGGNPKNISRMYDIFDDAGLGTVLYEPWAVDPNDMDVDTIPDAWELSYFS
ncbi:hypothetical protein D1BOALGB6SA_2787, partial [Olavius sp. associated proteobacterium Delta 1]